MNKWKVAFFALLLIIFAAIVGLFLWATSPVEEMSIPEESTKPKKQENILQVELTVQDFEKVINKVLEKEMDSFQLKITNRVELLSELQVFGISVPIALYFDPEVKEDGNIQLKQTAANVGRLNLPNETVLKIMKDSIEFPDWIIIRPDLNVIDIELEKVELIDGTKVKAREIDLEQDKVVLEIVLSD